MNFLFANCKYENWRACKQHEIFGLKKASLPDMAAGDIILVRLTGHSGNPYGVKAIWRLDSVTSTAWRK